MNALTKAPPLASEGTELLVPLRLLVPFETAQRELRATYGYAPDLPSLIRLWLACATDSRVRKQFEAAALQTNANVIPSDEEDESDGDDF